MKLVVNISRNEATSGRMSFVCPEKKSSIGEISEYGVGQSRYFATIL
jgi:hypothetical protein